LDEAWNISALEGEEGEMAISENSIRDTKVIFLNNNGTKMVKISQNRTLPYEILLDFDRWVLVKNTLNHYNNCYNYMKNNPKAGFQVLNKVFMVLMMKHCNDFSHDEEKYDVIFSTTFPDAQASIAPAIRKIIGFLLVRNEEKDLIKETFDFITSIFNHELGHQDKVFLKQIALEAAADFPLKDNDPILDSLVFFLQ